MGPKSDEKERKLGSSLPNLGPHKYLEFNASIQQESVKILQQPVPNNNTLLHLRINELTRTQKNVQNKMDRGRGITLMVSLKAVYVKCM